MYQLQFDPEMRCLLWWWCFSPWNCWFSVLLSEPQGWVKSLPWVTLKRVGQICLPKSAIERCISIIYTYIFHQEFSFLLLRSRQISATFFKKIIIHPHPLAEDSHYILSFFQLMDIFGTSDGFYHRVINTSTNHQWLLINLINSKPWVPKDIRKISQRLTNLS